MENFRFEQFLVIFGGFVVIWLFYRVCLLESLLKRKNEIIESQAQTLKKLLADTTAAPNVLEAEILE